MYRYREYIITVLNFLVLLEMNCTRSTTLIPISNSLISLEVIWPTSLYNTTSIAQCPCSRNGSMQYAFRVCHLNGTWGEPDLAQCNISSTNSICALVSIYTEKNNYTFQAYV